MCRFLVYKGKEPIQLSHLLTRPLHSIANQVFDSRLRFVSDRPFNADGFGVGFFTPSDDVSVKEDSQGLNGDAQRKASEAMRERLLADAEERERPGVFKSIHPAWSNANLNRLAEKIRSPLVFAHVRASTMPGAPSEDNCHPWTFGKLMWMHNGQISDFTLIKRRLQSNLSEELFLFPSGYTDSEWAFALFLSKLKDPHAHHFSTMELRTAMLETIAHINAMYKDAIAETDRKPSPHLLNFVVSDGENVIATRYISSRTDEASSLFFSSGTTFEEYAEGGHYRMTKADKREDIIMIASEPLTFEQKDWMEVKTNTMVVITPKMNLLQVPIMDEFYVSPHEEHGRSSDFVLSQGYGHGLAVNRTVVPV
ncbi:glutamine amidotransferase subunit [Naganishia albida]|nr:glutamine amidotransferase subunit [Naganishia albida]